MAGVWRNLDQDKRLELMRRKYSGEDVGVLAAEIGMNSVTLNRRLQELRAQMDGASEASESVAPILKAPKPKDLPEFPDLFDVLRKGPISLGELSRKYDRSEATIIDLIDQMEEAGYVIERGRGNRVTINTVKHPKVEYNPARTLADEVGHEVSFAVASDAHAGSTHAQISARQKFIEIAYEEYGVRHIFDPGDLTAGVYGYRGQEYDLVPAVRPLPKMAYKATEGQIWLADVYTPHLPDLRYYQLGGNHDYWHIMNSGIDAVSNFCKRREDTVFLGYDVADIPLTDRVSIRLWHPTGGVPYALSYRLQKGMEQLAFEELTRAVESNENPKVRFLLAGHLHVEGKFHRGPMVAAQVGCFEGQTNYLKRKGLYPSIGGAIFRVRVTDAGMVQRVEYTFVPFTEIDDDWKNYPTPPGTSDLDEPDKTDVLFALR